MERVRRIEWEGYREKDREREERRGEEGEQLLFTDWARKYGENE